MNYFLYFFCFFILLVSCEDTKKTLPENNKTIEIETTSISKDTLQKKESKSEEKNYPKLTQDNVVDFLSQYGKENPETLVKITTSYGNIFMELYKDTPLHRANFIYLIKQNYFAETFFHRVTPNFIIQGGDSDNISTAKKRSEIGKDYRIPAEINSRKHSFGSVSGAKQYRKNPDKLSAPFEFFIFLGPLSSTSHLNGNYTIFGKVTQGMEIVEKIANLPADKGEWPLQNVYLDVEIISKQ